MTGRRHGHAHQGSGNQGGGSRRRLAAALGVTLLVLLAEVAGAALTGSLALLADAGHMVTDAAGLVLALGAASLALRPPSGRRTWGLARLEVLAAGGQATILLAVGLFALAEGVRRLLTPSAVQGGALLVFGLVGLVGNLVSIGLLAGGRRANLNMRAAFLEVVNDALGSVAVIVGAVVVALTGWTRADALAGMLISLLILPRAALILRESGSLLLETSPAELDLEAVRRHMLSVPGVVGVHDLHVTRIATQLPVLTAHVEVTSQCLDSGRAHEVLDRLQLCLRDHFPISVEHSTFQLEPPGHRLHESHGHA